MTSLSRLVRYRAITYFDAVRRYGSIREAARRLNVAASAVNRQLLRFEEDAGMLLFERLADGMKLTAAGEVFARHVTTVLQDEKRATNELNALRGLRHGELNVIAIESLGATVLPDLVGTMSDRHPGVRLSIQTSSSTLIPNALICGSADVGLGLSLPPNPQLQQLASARLALGAVMRPDHPLAAERTLTLDACAVYPLLLPTPRLSTHTVLAPHLADLGGPLTVAAEVDSLELLRSLTRRVNAIAFHFRIGLEAELQTRRLAFIPLQSAAPPPPADSTNPVRPILLMRPTRSPGLITSDLALYLRRGRTVSAALDAFVTLARDHLAELESTEPPCCRIANG